MRHHHYGSNMRAPPVPRQVPRRVRFDGKTIFFSRRRNEDESFEVTLVSARDGARNKKR
jgi:hypothetical protein